MKRSSEEEDEWVVTVGIKTGVRKEMERESFVQPSITFLGFKFIWLHFSLIHSRGRKQHVGGGRTERMRRRKRWMGKDRTERKEGLKIINVSVKTCKQRLMQGT